MRRWPDIVNAWPERERDPTGWLPVDIEGLDAHRKTRFGQRSRALRDYLVSDVSVEDICRRCSVGRSELYDMIERAFQARPDGHPYGYLACIPYYRIKPYESGQQVPTGKAGRFSNFLRRHPELHAALDDWVLGRRAVAGAPVRGRAAKALWVAFRDECIKVGIDPQQDYPFTNSDGGREAVRVYARGRLEASFVDAARVGFGDGAGRLAASSGEPSPGNIARRPYASVQFDGHRIDTTLVVRLQDPMGDDDLQPLSRIWLLAIIDERSRAVLGYSLSLAENYSMDDVLSAFRSAFEPWTRKELPDSSIAYEPGAGLPSGVVDGVAWRTFDRVKFDNALAHRSRWLQERLIDAGVGEIVTNRPGSPRSNPIIERFFKTFEALTFHQWPTTTGSSPNDPRRRNPDAAAKRLEVGFEDLLLVTDVAIANYNAAPHSELHGRSPLEYLRMRAGSGTEIARYTPHQGPGSLTLFRRRFSVTIRADAGAGHRPTVKFLGVLYSGDCLQEALRYRGRKSVFEVDINDIRSGYLYVDGACLGRLDASPRWRERPHSIQTRRAILKAIKQRRIASGSARPVSDFLGYLETRARLSRRDRSRLVRAQIEAGDAPAPEPPPDAAPTGDALGQPRRISLSERPD